MNAGSDEPARAADGESAQNEARVTAGVLGIVSHDIRAPLGVILGAVAELLDPRMGPLTDEQRNLVRLVRRSGERLSRLAANVQFLNREEAGSVQLARQLLDARDVARRAVESFERSGEIGKLNVALHVTGERAEIDADPELLVHALVNVLANAVRFARRDVTVTVTSDAQATTIAVEDDGPGIVPETIAHLFDPRARLGPPGKGMPRGLGLLIVKGIVDAHGGTVSAETRLGEGDRAIGARVHVAFPRTSSV